MVAAVVILYYPDLPVLRRLLDSVFEQVDAIIAVDNTPGDCTELASYFEVYPNPVCYIPLGRNLGIAAAQNIGIRKSLSEGYSHFLLLDQDSALPPGMVSKLLDAEKSLIQSGERVAAVGPQFVDEKTGRGSFAIRCGIFWVNKIKLDPQSSLPVETDHLIASGSLISAATIEAVGLMCEGLFIDWVDIEWALRARSFGYKSYYVPNAVMVHSVGDAVIQVLGRDVHLHSDFRNYYLLRNATYLMGVRSMGWRWKLTFLPRIPCYLVLYPCLSRSKFKNAKLLLRAFMDGVCGRLGPLVES